MGIAITAYPWLSEETVDFITARLRPDMRLLDIGSGGSTLYYAQRVAYVRAIETNTEWLDPMNTYIEAENLTNVELMYAEPTVEAVCGMAVTDELYDVVSIDTFPYIQFPPPLKCGLLRSEILAGVLPYLKPDAMWILDDWPDGLMWATIDEELFEGHDIVDFPLRGPLGTRIVLPQGGK